MVEVNKKETFFLVLSREVINPTINPSSFAWSTLLLLSFQEKENATLKLSGNVTNMLQILFNWFKIMSYITIP